MRLVTFALVSLLLPVLSVAAQQSAPPDLTLEAIFARGDFAGSPMPDVHWLRDGASWVTTRADPAGGDDIIKVEAATGAVTVLADAALFTDSAGNRIHLEGITLSADGAKALVYHNSVRVWRTNAKGVYHIVDFASKQVTALSLAPGLQMYAKFSPDGKEVAFARDNDLFVVDVATRAERAVTRDGSERIINGTGDWVYEEELGVRDGFRWSPDSKHLAFWRFDETPVPQYPLLDQSQVHARVNLIRYPQPGDANPLVKVGVADPASGHTVWMHTESDSGYVATLAWIDADTLAIQRLDRHQSRVDLLFASAATGGTRRVLIDTDSAWLWLDPEAPHMLAGGKLFVWPSERSGWRRYYLYQRDGEPVRALTPDSIDAENVAGIVEKTQEILITEATPTPMQRQVFGYGLTRKPERRPVTTEPGTHEVNASPNGRWFLDVHTSAGVPRAATLREFPSLAVKRVVEGNAALRENLARLTRPPQFFQIPMPDGTRLNAWRIVSSAFDSTKPHPVLMYVYGGPNSQMVVDAFVPNNRELWHQYMAKRGYVVVCVDNRGTGGRGSAFRHRVYLRLGQLESQDQLDAAAWIAQHPWADSTRMAMWGWSGGGFLTAMTTSRGGSRFAAGISVAPVTDFRLYDDIWTERYMRTPAENPDGYKNSSVMTYASGLTTRLLLVHGTSDDNVHPQNSFWLANALQAKNIQFEMMLYPGRTHAIAGAATQFDLFTMMTEFLDRTMGVTPAGKAR